ncbi:MAG: hypothetical protein J6Z43_11415 [Clostridiales bacterium]|nr:hypothetical protein [Clostridiales bacterium]
MQSDKRIYTLSEESPYRAVVKLGVPLLLILDHFFGFGGMLWAQPVTEVVMMICSVALLLWVIKREEVV